MCISKGTQGYDKAMATSLCRSLKRAFDFVALKLLNLQLGHTQQQLVLYLLCCRTCVPAYLQKFTFLKKHLQNLLLPAGFLCDLNSITYHLFVIYNKAVATSLCRNLKHAFDFNCFLTFNLIYNLVHVQQQLQQLVLYVLC